MNTNGGGANTTVHGLLFEQDTSLRKSLEQQGFVVRDELYKSGRKQISKEIVEFGGKRIGYLAGKNKLYSQFLSSFGIDWKNKISWQMKPDEAFVNEVTKTVYIVEKKFQRRSGSTDEKLQTCDFKKKMYEILICDTGYQVEYIYLCNDWFKNKRYKNTAQYIKESGCHIYYNDLPLSAIGLGPNILDVN